MSAPVLVDCPSCKRPTLKRMISGGAGLVFKGSGFYLTDYKKSNSSPAGKERSSTKDSTSSTGTSDSSSSSDTSGSSTAASSPPLPKEKP